MDKIIITMLGKKALVSREFAPLFIKKNKLVQEAISLKEKIRVEKIPAAEALKMTDEVTGKIIRINKEINAKHAFVEFI